MPAPLLHFAREPLTAIRSVAQDAAPHFKPNGLWVSAGAGGDSWPAWCRSERFSLERLRCVTEVRLRPDAAVLHITSADELDAFGARYSERETPRHWRFDFPWKGVAVDYQGIIIAPYVWERRLSDLLWYYTWDCASGCIWDAGAVAELVPRPDMESVSHADQAATPLTEAAA